MFLEFRNVFFWHNQLSFPATTTEGFKVFLLEEQVGSLAVATVEEARFAGIAKGLAVALAGFEKALDRFRDELLVTSFEKREKVIDAVAALDGIACPQWIETPDSFLEGFRPGIQQKRVGRLDGCGEKADRQVGGKFEAE